jgi:integrase/recombinase XerD
MSGTRYAAESLPVYVTRSDVARLMLACPTARDRMLIELLWRTGARVSEIVEARVGDLTDQGIRLPNRKQRRHAEKHVFLATEFRERLRAFCAGLPLATPIVRRADGGPLTPRRVEQIVARAAVAAEIYRERRRGEGRRPVWPHTLRHGSAVHLLLNGAPVTAAQRQLGHSDLDSTAVYTRIADPDMARIVAAVEY